MNIRGPNLGDTIMLVLIIALTLASLSLLVIGFRGRIAQRGVFCGKCRFDLCGVDLASSGALCPECGRAVHDPMAQRMSLRRRSRPMLIVGGLLLLVSIGLGGVLASGNAAAIYARMPDRVVAQGALWGSDDALAEAVARLGAPDVTMADAIRRRLIEHALDRQGDRTRAWDPAWGDVLAISLFDESLSDDQLRRYLTQGSRLSARVRDRVYPGAQEIGFRVEHVKDRLGAASGGGATQYTISRQILGQGVLTDDTEPLAQPEPMTAGQAVRINSSSGISSYVSSGRISATSEALSQPPGTIVPVYIDYQITVYDPQRDVVILNDAHRFEQSVTIVDPSRPIVELVKNDAMAQPACQAVRVGELEVRLEPSDLHGGGVVQFLTVALQSGRVPEAISGRMMLVIDDQEIPIGGTIFESSMGSFGTIISWSVLESDEEAMRQARAAHRVLLERETASLILRPDPDAALLNPSVDRILDVSILFRDVAVEALGEGENSPTSWANRVWYDGQCVPE